MSAGACTKASWSVSAAVVEARRATTRPRGGSTIHGTQERAHRAASIAVAAPATLGAHRRANQQIGDMHGRARNTLKILNTTPGPLARRQSTHEQVCEATPSRHQVEDHPPDGRTRRGHGERIIPVIG